MRRDNTCHHIYSHIWDEWHQPHICRHERCIQSDDTDRYLQHCRQFQAPPHGHTHTHTGMTIYMNGHNASYICINERTTVRATNDMCVVIYEAAKSHRCTCILSGMRDSHIHTRRDYIRAYSQLFMYIHTQARPVTNTRQSALHDMYIIYPSTTSTPLHATHKTHTHREVWRYSSTSYLRTYMS